MDGMTVARTAHFVLHRKAVSQAMRESLFPGNPGVPEADGAWLGALIPKRWAKRAVTRNAVRRQIYGVASEFAARLGGGAHVVRLRSAFSRTEFPSATSTALKDAVRVELRQLFAGYAA